MEMVRQNSDYDHALEQLATEYRITLDEARASGDLLDESDAALRRRELRLEREIETLGPVNPAAIEQYEAVSERYEFLQRQYSDLQRPKPIWKQLSAKSTPVWPNASKRPSEK